MKSTTCAKQGDGPAPETIPPNAFTGVVSAKQKLTDLVSGTERGLRARSYLRGLVEEAQVR